MSNVKRIFLGEVNGYGVFLFIGCFILELWYCIKGGL